MKFWRSYRAFFIALFLTVIIGQATYTSARAADESEDATWASAEKHLNAINLAKDLYPSQKCESSWKILWTFAKQGEVEARYRLYSRLRYSDMEIPGRSGDAVSRSRDLDILAVHAAGAKDKEGFLVVQYKTMQVVFPQGWYNFYKCALLNNVRQDCSRIAVEEKLVPSFEDYAREIDALIAQGATVMCPNNFGSAGEMLH